MESSTSGSILFGLAAILALVLLNAFFVAAEFALVGARRTRLEEMAKAGDRKASLAAKAVQTLDRYISATQLGITLASLGLGWIGKPALAGLIEGGFRMLPGNLEIIAAHTVAVVISFGIITLLHIVLGELMPKALALLYPEQVSSWLAAPLMGFTWVMAGPIAILNGTANRLLKLMGIRSPGEHERLHSPEEIRMLVEQSQEAGGLGREDARMIEGIFEFSEKTAEEVMTPRTRMQALTTNQTVGQAADLVARARRSRYPVHGGSLDEIIGIVHAKDILGALRNSPDTPVGTLARQPLFVPGTREVEDVLADMKRLKIHLAVVLDEYGGTAGLVTMEDLIEEIVGPIFDEHDKPELPASTEGAAVVDGAMPISDFNTEHETNLDDGDYTTVGGYIFGQIGRLPKPGDLVTSGSLVFEVVTMDGRRVGSVRWYRGDPAPQVVRGDQ